MELIVASFLAVFLWFSAHVVMVISQGFLRRREAKRENAFQPVLPAPPTPPARSLSPSSGTAQEPALA